MDHYLSPLFAPRSVAIVGISATSDRGGNAFLDRVLRHGYQGRVYAIGRNGGEINGQRIYRSIEELPEVPDLVFGAVSPMATPEAMISAAAAGVPVGVVFTAGFAEMSSDGAQSEHEMIARCRELGMRIVGPNCMGVFNTSISMQLSDVESVDPGPIGFVSQSGNIALTMFDHAKRYDLGFHTFVSFGNQADVPAIDYIECMAADDSVKVILLYLESLQENAGGDFIARAREVAKKKPIVAIKGGVTKAGRRAAASHTSRLSASSDIYDAAFKQAGVIQVHDLDHVLAVVDALLRCPPMEGDNVAIVGSGGGHSTIGTDCVERAGLQVPPFDDELKRTFGEHLPQWAPMSNPVDMTGGFTEDLRLFQTLMRYPLSRPDFDAGLSYGLYGGDWRPDLVDDNGLTFESAAPLLGELQNELGKPIVFYTPFGQVNEPAFTAMRRAGVPCYGSLAEAAAGLAALRERGEFLAQVDGRSASTSGAVTEQAPGGSGFALTEFDSLQRIAKAGVPVVQQELVHGADEAAAAADRIGYPVVLKAQLANVAHKSDVGGVRLGLSSKDDVVGAYREMAVRVGADDSVPFTVSRQVSGKREILLGIQRDDTFGHTIVVGLGGLLTEVAARVAVIVPPIELGDFEAAIARSPIADYLGSWRGNAPVDLEALHTSVAALHAMCEGDATVQSVDVNPLTVVDGRLQAVDAAVVLNAAPDAEGK